MNFAIAATGMYFFGAVAIFLIVADRRLVSKQNKRMGRTMNRFERLKAMGNAWLFFAWIGSFLLTLAFLLQAVNVGKIHPTVPPNTRGLSVAGAVLLFGCLFGYVRSIRSRCGPRNSM